MNPITQFLDAWNEPPMRHAMVLHFPIVLSVIGPVITIMAALFWSKCKIFRWAAVVLFVAMLASGYITKESGENAHDAVQGSLSEAGEELLHEHEELGEKVWIFSAVTLLLVAGSFVPKAKIGRSSAWLAVIGSMALAGWVGNTADHGGRLVYQYGAGTPDKFADLFKSSDDNDIEVEEDPRLTFFRNEVKPIFVNHCWKCHNAKRAKRSGKLDQMSIVNLLAGGRSGEPAVVPGNPAASMIVIKVRHEDEDERMPPMGEALSEEQISVLERWIAQGAVWETQLAVASPSEDDSHDSHSHDD